MVTKTISSAPTSPHKKYGFFKTKSAEEHCKSTAKFYQSRFSHVPSLTSENLLSDFSCNDVILVDCRTAPERKVSMMEGAVSLKEFESSYRQHDGVPDDTKVILYCTIGYRSGMEAKRLLQKYSGLQGNIQSLDGIVSFTHALEKDTTSPSWSVVDPITLLPTTKVHCFGPLWACPHEKYTAISYPFPILVVRTMQVGLTLTVRTLQSVAYNAYHCCRKSKVD